MITPSYDRVCAHERESKTGGERSTTHSYTCRVSTGQQTIGQKKKQKTSHVMTPLRCRHTKWKRGDLVASNLGKSQVYSIEIRDQSLKQLLFAIIIKSNQTAGCI